VLKGHGNKVKKRVATDGDVIASGSQHFTVKVWRSESGGLIWTLEGHISSTRSPSRAMRLQVVLKI